MKWNIDLVETGYFVKTTCEGDFTVEDCLQMIADLISYPFWRPGLKLVVDYRNVTFNDVRMDDLLMIREFHSSNDERLGSSKIVFLMNPPEPFGIGRQYEIIAEAKVSSEMHVFSDEQEAMTWLHSLPGGHFIN